MSLYKFSKTFHKLLLSGAIQTKLTRPEVAANTKKVERNIASKLFQKFTRVQDAFRVFDQDLTGEVGFLYVAQETYCYAFAYRCPMNNSGPGLRASGSF